MRLPGYIDNKKKDVLVHGIGPTQGLDNATLIARVKYSIKGSNSFLFVSAIKVINSKKKILK